MSRAGRLELRAAGTRTSVSVKSAFHVCVFSDSQGTSVQMPLYMTENHNAGREACSMYTQSYKQAWSFGNHADTAHFLASSFLCPRARRACWLGPQDVRPSASSQRQLSLTVGQESRARLGGKSCKLWRNSSSFCHYLKGPPGEPGWPRRLRPVTVHSTGLQANQCH